MGKFVCNACGKQADKRNARVCGGCDVALCGGCAANKQNLCGKCFEYLGYLN